jgi:hypothetical protein
VSPASRPAPRPALAALGAAALLLAALLPSAPARADAEPVDEFALKAAFLFNFTRFVQWPEEAFESAESPFRICVLGSDPFGARLDALAERRVGVRPITIERLPGTETLRRCQIAFIAADQQAAWRNAGGNALGPATLTVADDGRFARDGGMIALVTSGRRIQLHVNLVSLQGSTLRISAKLLEVAEVRHERVGGRG